MIAEHGPPNYQQTLPHTKEPVASIWDINLWVQLRRQARFKTVFPGAEHETSSLVRSATQGAEPVTTPGASVLAAGRAGFLGDEELRCSDKTSVPRAAKRAKV